MSAPTLEAARRDFYAAAGLSAQRDQSAGWWPCRLGPVTLRFPNFRWRRAAIQHHDLHHVLTGYPCDFGGELELAAWEFAAGRFPHPGATLFCLPLVGLGALLRPRRALAAFRAGRRSHSLYGLPLTPELLALPLDRLRRQLRRPTPERWRGGDGLAWAWLALRALALCLAPLGLLLWPLVA